MGFSIGVKMRNYKKDKIIKKLKELNIAFSRDQITIPQNVTIGNGTLGKIDFLTNYHNYFAVRHYKNKHREWYGIL